MNYYVNVINETIEYIEDSIGERLTLTELSGKFDISDFHFNRMFKTVAGISLKQYVLGRKLTKAVEMLGSTTQPVIDIALELGFEYPEVFSRAFKKQFGLSPASFRESMPSVQGIERACIVERDIINHRGVLALKGESMFLDRQVLRGVSVSVNTGDIDFERTLRAGTEGFILESATDEWLDQKTFCTVVSCDGEDNGEYTVFCGRKLVQGFDEIAGTACLQERIVPQGWYVCFRYQGDMFDIREAFVDDLYRWVMVKEAELSPNGVGMFNIYGSNYPEDNTVQILIPVRNPV